MKNKTQPPENGIYVYCVIRTPGETKNFGNIGFGGKEVYTIDYKEFSSVASVAPLKKYDMENEKEIETHQNVVKMVMMEHSVIPVAYGMVFKSRKLVLASMKVAQKAMKKTLNVVEGKVELGIKILNQQGQASQLDTGSCVEEFEKELGKLSSDSKKLTLFSKRLLMNTAYLVEKDRVDAFSDAVEALETKYKPLNIQYSGPWPAYNFVDIKILSKQQEGGR
ncbi:MAG TPA: GvpL/GvpF family gas vesicle protein [Methanosarcina sp.]|nr:GvpL/GvpF family gas vesicle protein [Methanosarcina sp.]